MATGLYQNLGKYNSEDKWNKDLLQKLLDYEQQQKVQRQINQLSDYKWKGVTTTTTGVFGSSKGYIYYDDSGANTYISPENQEELLREKSLIAYQIETDKYFRKLKRQVQRDLK